MTKSRSPHNALHSPSIIKFYVVPLSGTQRATRSSCKAVPPNTVDEVSQDVMYDAQFYTGAEDFLVRTRSKQSQDDLYAQSDGESSDRRRDLC